MRHRFALCTIPFLLATLVAQAPKNQPVARPDDRFKADVLLIVAHPDDETGVTAYLAQLADQHKGVAALYLTHGEAGQNHMGPERAASLGAVREMELRHAMTELGVQNVWFLDGLDTPGQNVLQSLGRWHHGAALEEVVRIVRLTRPEVIITWLPGFFIGENHGDHQASGVLATEAFDIAGDPSVYPAQLAAPVRTNETLLEGLRPWQPKKLYYFPDSQDQDLFKGSGPQLPTGGVSSTRNVPYWLMSMEGFGFHLTQYRSYIEKFNKLDEQHLLAKGKEDGWSDGGDLTFGKSNVGGSPKDDVLAGMTPGPIPFVAHAVTPPDTKTGVSVELSGPWGFYETFRRVHGLQHLPKAAVPEIAIAMGATLQIPLLLNNATASPKDIKLALSTPEGWTDQTGVATYTVGANEDLPVLLTVTAPKQTATTPDEIVATAQSDGKTVGTIKLRVKRREGGLPQEW